MTNQAKNLRFRRVTRGPNEHWGGLYRTEDGRFEVEDKDDSLTRNCRRVPFSASWYVTERAPYVTASLVPNIGAGTILICGVDTKREALQILDAFLNGTPIPPQYVW